MGLATMFCQRVNIREVQDHLLSGKWQLKLSLLILLIVTAPLSQADESEVILIFGDSLSAAYGFERSKAWPALLEDYLDEQGLPYRVVNASRSGETTAGGLRRLPDTLEKYAPVITLVQLGGNDGLRGHSPQRVRSNLGEMIELAKAAGSRVMLLGIRIPPNYGPAYTESFAQIYPALAEEYDTALVPFLLKGTWDKEGMMQDDGIHPTAEAQPRILELVWQELEQMLPPAGS